MSPVTKADSVSLWRSVRVVAWSFIGIRKGSESKQDIARVKPLHVIAVGITGAALFVVSLVILVNWVVAK
jgi:hypothetical protein